MSKTKGIVRKGVSFSGDSSSDDESNTPIVTQTHPNVDVFLGDYMGNILGLRIIPPTSEDTQTTMSLNQNDDDGYLSISEDESEDEEVQEKKPITALTRFLAKKAGIDIDTLRQRRNSDNGASFKPSVSSDLHAGAITTIVSGGNYVITGGHDESVKLCKRNTETGKVKEFGALHRHSCGVTASAITSNGQLMLSAGEDGTIFVWSNYRWNCIAVLKKHTAAVLSIVIHPTAPLAISIGKDHKMYMWDLRPDSIKMVSAAILPKVKPKWGSVPEQPLSILFSPNGEYYTIAYPRNLHVYNAVGPNAGRISHIIEDESIKIMSQCFLDDRRVIVGADDGSLYIIDIVTSCVLEQMKGEHKNRVRFLRVLDNSKMSWMFQYYKNDEMPDNGGVAKSYLVISGDTDGKIVLTKVDMCVDSKEVVRQVKRQCKEKKPLFLRRQQGEDIDQYEDDDVESNDENDDEDREEIVIEDEIELKHRVLCFVNTKTRLQCITVMYPFKNTDENLYAGMGSVADTDGRDTMGDDEYFGEKRKRKRAAEEEKPNKKSARDSRNGKDSDGKFDKKNEKGGKFGKNKYDQDDSKFKKFGKNENGRPRFEDEPETKKKPVVATGGPTLRKPNRKTQEAKSLAGTKKASKIGNFGNKQRPARGKKRF